MGRHSIQPQRDRSVHIARIGQGCRYVAKHVRHPVAHLSAAISLHVVALFILEKTPILVLFGIH
jgi:hypothetical protein